MYEQRQKRTQSSSTSSKPSSSAVRQSVRANKTQSNSSYAKQRAPAQRGEATVHGPEPQNVVNRNVNENGLPEHLKVGGEIITGSPMNKVVVERNSADPEKVDALATTERIGENIVIKLAPGQEALLNHEFGHAMSLLKGLKVEPTIEVNGVPINDAPELERKATRDGERAAAIGAAAVTNVNPKPIHTLQQTGSAVQAKFSMAQRARNTVIQRGLKTLDNVPSRDLYAEDQAERERFNKEGGKLKEKIKSTEHQANTERETVKPGLKLDISKTYIWAVKTINGKDEIIIGDEIHPTTGEPTQGHPTLARDPDVPEGEEGSKTVAAKTAGELKWDNQLEAWILNNKSGRYGVSQRPENGHGVDKKFTFDTSVMKGVAKLFRERIGDSNFNIRYQPWRIMNPDGTVNKDKTGRSFELKSKQIPETNVPTPSKRKRKRDTENSGEQPRRSRRIEEKNQKK